MGTTLKAVAIVAAIAGVVSLSACDPNGGAPTVIETPTIVWDPSEPTGGLYDDPYVEAAFAASLGFVLASNAGDFTIAQLTETTTADRIAEIYKAHLGKHGRDNQNPVAYVGPFPRSPISVTEHADGSGADVLVCDIAAEWYISADHPEPTLDVEPLSLYLVVIDDDGVLKLDEVRGGEGSCDPSDIAVGRFDPVPELEGGSLRRPASQE